MIEDNNRSSFDSKPRTLKWLKLAIRIVRSKYSEVSRMNIFDKCVFLTIQRYFIEFS